MAFDNTKAMADLYGLDWKKVKVNLKDVKNQSIHIPIKKGVGFKFAEFQKILNGVDFTPVSLSIIGEAEASDKGVKINGQMFDWSQKALDKPKNGKHVLRVELFKWRKFKEPLAQGAKVVVLKKEIPK